MTVRTAAGTKISVSAAAPATFNETGFEALTFTLIGEITDAGSMGRTYNKVEHSPLSTRGKIKKKGSYDSGSQQFVVGLDRADAGQVIMEAASTDDDDHYFKLEDQDGTVTYYAGNVMSWVINRGTVDNIVTATANIEVQQRNNVDFIVVEP